MWSTIIDHIETCMQRQRGAVKSAQWKYIFTLCTVNTHPHTHEKPNKSHNVSFMLSRARECNDIRL